MKGEREGEGERWRSWVGELGGEAKQDMPNRRYEAGGSARRSMMEKGEGMENRPRGEAKKRESAAVARVASRTGLHFTRRSS